MAAHAFTFLCQIFIHDEFSMPQIIQDWAKVCGISVDQVGSGLILQQHIESYCSLFLYILKSKQERQLDFAKHEKKQCSSMSVLIFHVGRCLSF